MEIIPPAPEAIPAPAIVVLGRFQPLHKGHTFLILENESSLSKELGVTLGSDELKAIAQK